LTVCNICSEQNVDSDILPALCHRVVGMWLPPFMRNLLPPSSTLQV